MPQFMLSVHHVGDYPTPPAEVVEQMFADVSAFNAHLTDSGALVFACGLLPKATASTVRFDDGQVQVAPGPFSSGGEQLGGFWIVQAPDEQAALEMARQGALACRGSVEVRQLQGE